MNNADAPSAHDIVNYLNGLDESHIVLGYGSLLSRDSRERFSGIKTYGIPVMVKGFERAWVTRIKNVAKKLNAQLIPAQLNPALQEREKDYRFTQVSPEQIAFDATMDINSESALYEALSGRTLWVCETLHCSPADDQFPVSQTYVDTCLAGCLEHAGEKAAANFVRHTSLWDHPRVNDRALPKYPRAANVDKATRDKIDTILSNNLLF